MLKELFRREFQSFAFLFMWFALLYARFDVLFSSVTDVILTIIAFVFIMIEVKDIYYQCNKLKSEKKET